MPLTCRFLVPPAGFEPALTAPEGVAPPGPDQRKRARGRPCWTRIGHGAITAGHDLANRPMACHQPGERPPREPDPAPWYAAPAVAGWRAMSTLTQVTEARLALRRRLAIMRPDTGAEPDPAPVGRDRPTWVCRSVVIVRASPRVSIPLVLTTPGLIQADYSRPIDGRVAALGW